MVSQVDEIRKIEDIGGQPKMTYWTPDGRSIRAMPDIHEYSKTQNGKIVENGMRDANLDKGWLTTKPDILKPYCEGCDRWHDTQKEVDTCIKRKSLLLEYHQKRSEKELKPDISQRMDKLESMFSQILEKLGGS